MKPFAFIVGVVMLGLASASVRAEADASAREAVKMASDGVDSGLRGDLVSVYGVGSPAAIKTWWVIFYDPSVPTHGRAVKIDRDGVTRAYEAKGGVTYVQGLTFPPSQVTGEHRALAAAQDYAAKHSLAYDQVRALLRVTTTGEPLRWRVQLRDGKKSRGFVFVNAADGTFAMYSPPGSVPTKDGATGGVEGDVKHAAKSVKNTFLGVGGDLEEFFTGDRTVDQ